MLLSSAVYAAVELVPVGGRAAPDVALTIACSLILAISITLVASRLAVTRRRQLGVWFALVFLNLAAVAVEGTLFAPAAAPPSLLAGNLFRLAIVSAAVAGILALLFGRPSGAVMSRTESRPVIGWLWRLLVAAFLYVVLYLVVGGINYVLVTRPYYESHAGSLTVPSAQTILLYEPVRGLLIALSVVPLTRALRGRDIRMANAAAITGLLLFVAGGLVPLLPQASLPLFVRIASLWEIFAQNFPTGVACAYLFWSWVRPRPASGRGHPMFALAKRGPDAPSLLSLPWRCDPARSRRRRPAAKPACDSRAR